MVLGVTTQTHGPPRNYLSNSTTLAEHVVHRLRPGWDTFVLVSPLFWQPLTKGS